MATTDQTRMAVLGGLSIAPMTGYALREQIRDALGHFWAESFGQIYPALTALERDGLIERQAALRAGSSTFALTPLGTERLRELLAEAPQPVKPRNGVLLRLFFGRQLGQEACRKLVADTRATAEAELAGMCRIREELEADTGPDAPYILLTVLAGEHAARASLAWADEALGVLDGLASAAPPAANSAATPARKHS
ncbi:MULTISPECIES: PadR family transcriptional regulator [Cryobacterium]|uniref:PadR family transcriptional regulator n=1 Tax=Cryobacterium TaxID=69578 RepID=UPI000CD48F92|nr:MULTISPECIES: PadR family transcriptional regulator [Cryobacterium]POH63713.1 PadR family transcriptional regulator [Cryobacterium zongtaii]TFC40845.1 PadR family transcriptional regulator [Cryobacterium sp. TMN-39-2]